jgi:hypothetical protein
VATLHRVASVHPDARVVAVTHGALIRTVEAHLGIVEPGPPRNLTGRWVRVDGGRLLAGQRAVLRPTPPGAAGSPPGAAGSPPGAGTEGSPPGAGTAPPPPMPVEPVPS